MNKDLFLFSYKLQSLILQIYKMDLILAKW